MKWLAFIGFLAAVVFAACFSVPDDQGKTCTTAADCQSPYSCVQLASGTRSCELVDLPKTGHVPPPGPPPDAGLPYYCADVSRVLNGYCVSNCHGADRGGSINQPFRLDYYEGDAGDLPGAFAEAARIKVRATDLQTMPPVGSPMPSLADRQLLGTWVTNGAPYCNDAGM